MTYMRDRLGMSYAYGFDDGDESGSLITRIERKRQRLEGYVGEFRRLATR